MFMFTVFRTLQVNRRIDADATSVAAEAGAAATEEEAASTTAARCLPVADPAAAAEVADRRHTATIAARRRTLTDRHHRSATTADRLLTATEITTDVDTVMCHVHTSLGTIANKIRRFNRDAIPATTAAIILETIIDATIIATIAAPHSARRVRREAIDAETRATNDARAATIERTENATAIPRRIAASIATEHLAPAVAEAEAVAKGNATAIVLAITRVARDVNCSKIHVR